MPASTSNPSLRQVADRLRPFGVLLLATDDHAKDAPSGMVVFKADPLLTAVADADYVVVCARASKDNESLIDGETIRGMKHGAILSNVARGALVDEQELRIALRSGQLSAVGLDVQRRQAPVTLANPLLGIPQALVTPHVAAFTDLMLSGTVTSVSGVMQNLISGKLPISVLNHPSTKVALRLRRRKGGGQVRIVELRTGHARVRMWCKSEESSLIVNSNK
jgi:D-3-phosphoglycerate dehydrogenase